MKACAITRISTDRHKKALLLAPELGILKGTCGAVLARLGRHEEVLAMLAEADNSNDMSRCLNAAF